MKIETMSVGEKGNIAGDSKSLGRKRSSTVAGKGLRRRLAIWSRWLHIYLSMLGLAVILFFSVTGLTLNHPDWFFEEHSVQATGIMSTDWLNSDTPPPTNWDENDYSHEVSKLEVAEFLRAEHGLKGSVSDFIAFEDECELTFEGPGYSANARINRDTGEYAVNTTSNDLVTILNDLHKGRNTGVAWSWVIDVSAVIGTCVALTGFALIFFLKLKRRSGILTSLVGCVLLGVMYLIAVS